MTGRGESLNTQLLFSLPRICSTLSRHFHKLSRNVHCPAFPSLLPRPVNHQPLFSHQSPFVRPWGFLRCFEHVLRCRVVGVGIWRALGIYNMLEVGWEGLVDFVVCCWVFWICAFRFWLVMATNTWSRGPHDRMIDQMGRSWSSDRSWPLLEHHWV